MAPDFQASIKYSQLFPQLICSSAPKAVHAFIFYDELL